MRPAVPRGRLSAASTDVVVDLHGLAGVADTFHPPVPNNFVHLLIPRSSDPAAAIRAIAVATAPLNRADEALLEACAELLAEHPDATGERALDQWRGCIRRRVNLQGIRWACEVADRLATRPRSLPERLRSDYPQVLAMFRAVPRPLLELVRINGYLRPDQIASVLEAITADLADAELRTTIDRIEVARLAKGVEPDAIDHPTLIVYLHGATVTDHVLASAIDRIAHRFAVALPALRPRTQYARLLTPNATLTQGYFLYKRYLQLVGLLDELYDPTSGHALTRPTLGGIERVLRRSPGS